MLHTYIHKKSTAQEGVFDLFGGRRRDASQKADTAESEK